jgi:epoxyqueuosine reductase
MELEEGIRVLAEGGLNLVAILDCDALPDRAAEMMRSSGIALDSYRRLVLIGHGGRRMWDALQARGMEKADPVDHYSISLTRCFIRDCLGDSRVLWLYPDTNYLVPLQQLGEAAGWCTPSPLGIGISPVYGLWLAYRAAFLVDAELPVTTSAPEPSPCIDCEERPCVQACPAAAVQSNEMDIEACISHRLRRRSSCADRCVARMACPYAPEHRYLLPQIQYHYACSLATLRSLYE